MAVKKIALIVGSTRVVRIGPKVVDYIHEVLNSSGITPKPEFSIVDIADFNLPIFDEKILPAQVPQMGQFEHEHSKKWSAEIEKYDGYVFVSGEYNGGVPGATKNSIDFLYHAWIGKPIYIITYGIFGGKHANESLKAIFEVMKLRQVSIRPALGFHGGVGPDLYAAAAGNLSNDTLKGWQETASIKEELLKGYEELIEKLETPAPAPVPA